MSVFEDNVNDLYDQFEEILADSDCDITAAEFQGILAGMLSAGLGKDDANWLSQVSELVNEEAALSEEIGSFVKNIFNETQLAFSDDDLLAPILIPDDAYPMIDRLEALSFWSQGFLLGFGLQFGDKQTLPQEISESLNDIAEISQVSIENEDNEEANIGLETLIEHIKVAVKMIYMELVKKSTSSSINPTQTDISKTIH